MSRPKLGEPRYRLRLRGAVWHLSWTDAQTGRTVALSTRQTDRGKAEIWRDQFLAGLAQPLPPPQPRIAEILDGYLAARQGRVAAHDRLGYGARPVRRLVGNLEPHMLSRSLYATLRAKEGVAGGTIRREIAVLRAALNWAAREEPPWIERAPYLEAPPPPLPRERWLTKEEVARLIVSCRGPYLRLFVVLAYHTAARTGAILDLTWDRVDFEHGRIEYNRPGRARNNKRRAIVPVNSALLPALQSARKLAVAEHDPDGRERPPHVIQFRGKPVRSVKKSFAEACGRAGIADCSPHVLRHTSATHMVMGGVPLAEIARMLGDTEQTVERVYGKHSPDFLRRAADALAGGFGPRLVTDALS